MAVLSAGEIFRIAMQAGFTPDQAVTMTAIALAESSGNTRAHNPNGEDSRGLWQINLRAHRAWAGNLNLWDPLVNAQAAYRVSGGGANISPWTVTHTTKGTRYRQYQTQAQEAARAAGYEVSGNFGGSPGYGNTVSAGQSGGAQTMSNVDWGALEGVTDWAGVRDYVTFSTTVRERFPSWSWAFDHPELGDLLKRAAEEEWSPALFESQLRATAWYQNRTESQRAWDILLENDPTVAEERLGDARTLVQQAASRLGARVSLEDQEKIAQRIVRDGLIDVEITGAILDAAGSFVAGEYESARQGIREMAAQYLMPTGDNWFLDLSVDQYAEKILTGEMTSEAVESFMREQAKSRFPHLSDFIDQGISLAAYFQPHKARAEAMLGRPIDLVNDQTWAPILGFSADGKETPRPMAAWEVDKFVRTMDEYWGTDTGRNEAASMVLNFRQAMGVAA